MGSREPIFFFFMLLGFIMEYLIILIVFIAIGMILLVGEYMEKVLRLKKTDTDLRAINTYALQRENGELRLQIKSLKTKLDQVEGELIRLKAKYCQSNIHL